MKNIVLLTTAWGARFGGINTFNRDFAGGLAKALHSDGKVYCAVLQGDEADVRDAAGLGVTLVPLGQSEVGKEFNITLVAHLREVLGETHHVSAVDYWIGHDVISGEAAVRASQKGGGRAALIMHMSFRDYGAAKHPGDQHALDGAEQQRKLFQDHPETILFANGPLLRDACKRLCRRDVQMLVPGFPPELLNTTPHDDVLSAITFGRMNRADDRIKNGRLAVKAFARAVKEAKDTAWAPQLLQTSPSLCVMGLDDADEIRDVQHIADQEADRLVNILPHAYSNDRTELFNEIKGSNLALMLSWHEGFGLAGWEAIAAGLPLIVSQNSGLYQLVAALPNSMEGCLLRVDIKGSDKGEEEDKKSVSDAMLTAAKDMTRRLQKARELREALKLKYGGCTWEATARQFLAGLGEPVRQEKPAAMDSLGRSEIASSIKATPPTIHGEAVLAAGEVEDIAQKAAAAAEELEAIKRRMAAVLRKSAVATDGLRKALGLEEKHETPLDARVREAVESLVNPPLDDGARALTQDELHEALDDDAKRVIGDLAEDFACLLVDEEDLASFRREQKESDIGLFLSLPTKNETLIEIMMARRDGKRPGFAAGGKWPRGLMAIPGPPIRNNPYSYEEILKVFQTFMDDRYLSMGEKTQWSAEKRRSECNLRHRAEIAAKKRQRYFVLNDLHDYPRVLDALRRDWPSVAFVEWGPDGKGRTDLLHLLKDLFRRRSGDVE